MPDDRPTIPRWLILMGLLTAMGPLAIDMYLPAFPSIASDLGASQGQVERTLASYLLGLALAQIFYGPVADRYGRKKPLILGLLIFIVSSLGCALTNDVDHLMFWRIAQAFGGASGMVIPRAVIRDNFETRDASKALSMLLLVMGVAPILAPIVGGQVLRIGNWRLIFAIMIIAAMLLLIASLFTMRETLAPDKITPLRLGIMARNYKELASHRRFLCYTLAGGFGSAGMFAYIMGSPRVFIEIFHVPPEYFGFLFGLNAASLIIASQISARLLNRFSPETLLKRAQISLAIMTLIGVLITLTGWITLFWLMVCLMGFMASQGFVNPNAAALALAEQGGRLGAASAMMGTVQMLCAAGAGLAESAWPSTTALPLTGTLATCACLSWLFGRVALAEPAQALDY
jgi:DHA1 family bicyclomycin/chloramphenicol resistance-like MFS transporter